MKKILIVKISSLGDIIHTFPAVSDAVHCCKDISFDWVVEESFCELPRMHPSVDRIIPIAFRRWRKSIIKNYSNGEYADFYKDLKKTEYDLIIDPQGLIKSGLIVNMARGHAKVGYGFTSAREPLASFFYNDKKKIAKTLHAITRIRILFSSALGYLIPQKEAIFNLNIKPVKLDFELPPKFILFVHGTSRANKCWQEEHWIELSNLLAKENLPVVLPWGNQEELDRANKIANKSTNSIFVLPKVNLFEIAYIISEAKGAVTLDTGFGHLVAALNVPAVSLYGPTKVELIGAMGENQEYMSLYNDSPINVFNQLMLLIKNK